MSANHSLIIFEGDMTSHLTQMFACFGLHLTGSIETAKGLAEIWEYTSWPRRGRPKNNIHKAVLYNGTWTAVLDREMNMVLDQNCCEACASKFNIRIFGYLIESVSGTAALYMYDPEKRRGLNIQNYEILEDFGEPIPQEAGISVEEMLGDGPMRIARRLGFSDSLFAHPTSKVQIVGLESPQRAAMQSDFGESTQKMKNANPPIQRVEKTWWKLW
ncbi:MAG: hypothetical protein ACRCUY_08865 [Thermoguttaceae bacterium]